VILAGERAPKPKDTDSPKPKEAKEAKEALEASAKVVAAAAAAAAAAVGQSGTKRESHLAAMARGIGKLLVYEALSY
jgi:hypothetical protein